MRSVMAAGCAAGGFILCRLWQPRGVSSRTVQLYLANAARIWVPFFAILRWQRGSA